MLRFVENRFATTNMCDLTSFAFFKQKQNKRKISINPNLITFDMNFSRASHGKKVLQEHSYIFHHLGDSHGYIHDFG